MNYVTTQSTAPKQKVAVLTGHSSGLGLEILKVLVATGEWKVHGFSDCEELFGWDTDLFVHHQVDLQWASDIKAEVVKIEEPVDVLINCAGINHIDWFANLSGTDWERVMDVNAKAIMVMTQALLPLLSPSGLREGGTILNIVSNAAHVPMTHSLIYNASKAAAHMMTLQMARELFKTHGITVFGISPNKLAGTGMSQYIESRVPALRGWTPKEAEDYQRAALPIGSETDPKTLAELIGFLLSTKERHRYLHGCDLPYGA